MGSGDSPLAKADAVAKSKDTGAEKGGIVTECREGVAALIVTVIREGLITPIDNFSNVIMLHQGKISKGTGSKDCEKKYIFNGLKPGKYDVSARPALSGSGYSLREVKAVSLGPNEIKEVELFYIPNELIRVEPDTGKVIKQYVNLKIRDDKPRWGPEVEIIAHLKTAGKDVNVYWGFEPHKNNGKYKAKIINGPNHQCKFVKEWNDKDKKWNGLGGGENATPRTVTNEQGITKIKVKLGWFGGNKYRVIASLCSKPKHPGVQSLKSDELKVWRKHYFQLSYLHGMAIHPLAKAIASFNVTIQRNLSLCYQSRTKIRQLAIKQKIQCLACLDSVFSTSRQITSNAAEDFSALHRSKTPRYLLLNFCHSDIIFTQIIRKWDAHIIHKSECLLLKISQPF